MKITNKDWEKAEELKEQFDYWYKAKRIGRQHVIHKSIGEMKILCGTKKYQCWNDEWNSVECIFCLKKGAKELLKKFKEEGCYGGVIMGAYHCFCGEVHKSGKQFYCKNCKEAIKLLEGCSP